MKTFLTQCSVCKKIMQHGESGGDSGQWLDERHYSKMVGRPDVEVSHGYCPDCGNKLRNSLRKPKEAESPSIPTASFSPEMEALISVLENKKLLNRSEVAEAFASIQEKK